MVFSIDNTHEFICQCVNDFLALSMVMKWASVSVSAASRGDILGDLILYFQILALEYVY